MNKAHEEKFNFTRHELLALLKEIDRDIIDARYQIFSGEEFVEIQWLNHKKDTSYCKRICVTADSLKALTIDVLKHI